MTNSKADHVAKQAARAAANQPNLSMATQAVLKVISPQAVPRSSIIRDVYLDGPVDYIPNDTVEVNLKMSVSLPVPLPGIPQNQEFKARAMESIVTVSR
ncbi:MAG TPA: hypothetical protein V6D08_05545 [Candidatus Obscuribacterales bacterium]